MPSTIKPGGKDAKKHLKTGRVIGLLAALSFALAGITPAEQAAAADTFPSRCTSTGVVFCAGFDSNSEIDSFIVGLADPEANLPGFTDSLHMASGNSSLLFTLPLPNETYSGAYSRVLSEAGPGFGPGQTFYVQFRQMFSPEMFNPNLSGSGWKDITLTSSFGSYGDPLNIGVANDLTNYPKLFLGSQVFEQTPADNIPVSYAIDQWMTFYLKFTVGDWGQPNSSVEFWIGQENHPLKLVNSLSGLTFQKNPGDPDSGINSVLLGPDISPLIADNAFTWYDELIVSAQPIADPADSFYDNTAPTVPQNLSAQTVSATQINLSWSDSTDNVAVAGYKVFRNGVGIATTAEPLFSDNLLSPQTAYNYAVSAYDSAGNESAQSTTVAVTTPSLPDTVPPTIAITAPANGSALASTPVVLAANASDDVGIAGVQFFLDGTALGAEDLAAPYSTEWQATAALNGNHTASAVARDTNGNTAREEIVFILSLSSADTTAPSTPLNLSAVAVSANQASLTWVPADDNVGVIGYIIYRNGAEIKRTPKANFLDRKLSPETNYSYQVSAFDAAGNISGKSSSSAVTTPVALRHGKGHKPVAYEVLEGDLIKYPNDPTIYVLNNGTKHPIESWAVYSRQYKHRPVKTIPTTEQYPDGSIASFGSGTLLKTAYSPQIYLLLGNGTKYPFASMEEFNRFGYKPSQGREVSQEYLDAIPTSTLASLPYHTNGTFIKYKNRSAVYLMENKTKLPVSSPKVVLYSSDFAEVVEVPDSFQYPTGGQAAIRNPR